MGKYKVGDSIEFLLKRKDEMKKEKGNIVSERNSFFNGKRHIVEAKVYDPFSLGRKEVMNCFEVKERDILRKI